MEEAGSEAGALVATDSAAEGWAAEDRSTAGAVAWRSSFAEQTAVGLAVEDCAVVAETADWEVATAVADWEVATVVADLVEEKVAVGAAAGSAATVVADLVAARVVAGCSLRTVR